jgi:putative transposase
MSRRPIEVSVSREDQKQLRQLLRAGIQQVRVILRGLALEQLCLGLTAPAVAKIVHLTPQAVRRIGHRYKRGGLESALYERQGRGADPLLDESHQQRIIAMVCSQPPEGYAGWTVRLVAEQAVKRKLVPRVGRETVRVLLLSHDLKPWREKNVVRGGIEPGVPRKDGRRSGGV